MLVMLRLFYFSVWRLDQLLSARASAQEIGVARAAQTYSFKLQRGWEYQLDFYLHREITEWSPNVSGEAIVVTTDKNLGELKKSAEIIAVLSDRSRQAEIVEVRPLAGNVTGSGKVQ